jgi:signal transduction histidine kinase
MTAIDRQLEGWERREQRIYRILPYPLLAVSLLATGVDPSVSTRNFLWSLAVSAATAAWVWPIRPHAITADGTEEPTTRLEAMQVIVQLALTAVLVLLSGWFGIFAFSNYMYALLILPGRWRYVGVALNAAIVALSYTSGIPDNGMSWAEYGVLFVIISGLANIFGHYGVESARQSVRHKHVIANQEEANRRLEAALEENAGLHAQLLVQAREAGVLDERQRMAREIHDTLAQGLAGIITQLEAAERAPDWHEHIATARGLAREGLTEARRSVAGLSPRNLERAHLPEAIADAAKRWSESSGVPVSVETTGDPRPMIADVELALFRVCQESLTNIAKHAQATRVGLTLSYMDDLVTLDVRDDGVGFVPRPAPKNGNSGYGLPGMRARVQRVAGTLAVESTPGEGTAISANVPAIRVSAEAE